MDQKVIQILRTVRQGVSKKTNKPYEIVLVLTEQGDEIEVFGPAKQGDVVTEITFNDQYNKLQGKIIKPDRHDEVMKELEEIKRNTQIIYKAIKTLLDNQTTSGSQGQITTGAVPTPSPVTSSAIANRTTPATQVPEKPQGATATELDEKLERWKTNPPTGQSLAEPPPNDEDAPDFIDDIKTEDFPDDI